MHGRCWNQKKLHDIQNSSVFPGVDYLEFLDLGTEDGSDVEEVLPDFEGLSTSDYYSSPIFIENGIPIGATGELSTVLYVRIAPFS